MSVSQSGQIGIFKKMILCSAILNVGNGIKAIPHFESETKVQE